MQQGQYIWHRKDRKISSSKLFCPKLWSIVIKLCLVNSTKSSIDYLGQKDPCQRGHVIFNSNVKGILKTSYSLKPQALDILPVTLSCRLYNFFKLYLWERRPCHRGHRFGIDSNKEILTVMFPHRFCKDLYE